MSRDVMRTDGHLPGVRRNAKACPYCGSTDLIYDLAKASRGLVRCRDCARLFSKGNRVVKLTSF